MFSQSIGNLLRNLIPIPPDFFILLSEQSTMVVLTIENLYKYMEEPREELEHELTKNEHLADSLKIRNLQQLNRAFSTPIDREDIYRAIESLDWIVTHCKSTINEMLDLNVSPDASMLAICEELLNGSKALEQGYIKLAKDPAESESHAYTARHAHRRIERLYRHSLKELFTGEVKAEMLMKREIYHHLMDGSRKVHSAANTLQDIMVKLV